MFAQAACRQVKIAVKGCPAAGNAAEVKKKGHAG